MAKNNYMERMRQYQKGSFKGMTTAQRKDRYIQDVGKQVYDKAYDKAFEEDRNRTYGLFTRQYIPYKLTSESDKVAKPIALEARKSAEAKASDKFDEVTRYDDMLGRATNPYKYQPGGMRMYGDPKLGNQTFSNIVYQESEAGRQEALKEQMKETQADTTAMEEANAALQRQYSIGNKIEATGQSALQAGAKGLLKLADPLKGQTPNWSAAMIPNAAGETASLASGTIAGAATDAATDAAAELATNAATDVASKGAGKLATFASKYVNPQHAKAVNPYAIAGQIAGAGISYLSNDDDATTLNFGEGAGGVISGAASGASLGSLLGPVGTVVGGTIGGLYGLGKGLYQRNKARNTIGAVEDKKTEELNRIGAQMRAEGVKSREYSGYDFGRTLAKSGGPRMYQTAGFDMSMLANNPIKNVPIAPQETIGGNNAPSYMDVVRGATKGGQEVFSPENVAQAKQDARDFKTNVIDYAVENPLDATQIGLGTTALIANKIPTPITQGISSAADGINAGISTYRSNKYRKAGDDTKANLYAGFAAIDGMAAMPGSAGELASMAKMKQLYNMSKPVRNVMHDVQHYAHEFSPMITGYKTIQAGNQIADSGIDAPVYKNKFKAGGVKLPGGTMNPIPGSDAVEFKGRPHSKGGILLDQQTEVEGGETMDKVTMKNEGPSDYFFSKYLKLGGQSFAQRHKQLLKKGGTQQDIDALAQVQEKVAGRNPGVVEMERGGVRKYQFAGFGIANNGYSNPPLRGSMRDTDPTIYSQSQPNYYTPTNNINTDKYGPGAGLIVGAGNGQSDALPMLPYPDNVGNLAVMYDKDGNPIPPKNSSGTSATTKSVAGPVDEEQVMFDNEQEAMANLQPLPTIDTSPAAKGESSNDDLIMEDVDAQIANLEAKKEQIGLTKQEERALKRMYRDVPLGAYAAGAAQMIPAAYAFLRKEKAQKLMGPAGRIGAPKLERADFNKERSQNAADARALSKSIETSGAGPAGIIAKMAAYGRKQTGDMQIAAQEGRVNAGIQAQEAQMAQRANMANVQNAMAVDQLNTQMMEAQRVANENRRYMALDAASQRASGLAGDYLSYKAQERLARTMGSMGIYERERLAKSLLGKINPRTSKL